MNSFDTQYKNLISKTLTGHKKPTRSGIDAYSELGGMIEIAMAEGFPLTTLRKVSFSLITSELEFFIKGLTDKSWLQERNNHIYDEWCNPEIVLYAHDEVTKKKNGRRKGSRTDKWISVETFWC